MFIRLAGCDCQCPGCDTDYTTGRMLWSVKDLADKVRDIRGLRTRLVVVTGGEPFRQGLGSLVLHMRTARMQVQVETNGSLYDTTLAGIYPNVTVVCSPKSAKVHHALEPHITHYKYVMNAGAVDPSDGLPTDVLGTGVRPARPSTGFLGKIYLQPADEGNEVINQLNTKAVVESCLKWGYLLCLQTHKIVGLP